MVPDGVISNTYDTKIPQITEETANAIERSAVCLKLLPYIIAVTLGITKSADINKIPIS